MIGLSHFLVISAALFSLGIMCVLTRKNAINVLMGLELILNAANINLIAFSKFSTGNFDGQIFAIFIIVVAAAEAAVALAIVLSMYRIIRSVNLDRANTLKG
ncbi:MAG: NADH-quinone oxidoreductase subunit NuoK [Acidobacteriota bacterium]|jgi:NADH-quinone oxidoreductase subunit K